LRAGPFAFRPEFFRGQMFALDDPNHKLFVHSYIANNFPINMSRTHSQARYENFLFGADMPSWTFRLYILEYWAIILIIHGL
jgi:hypothetical protein